MLLISLQIVKGILVCNKVCVIGEGSFGTSFATLLANNGFAVNLWCYHIEVVENIKVKGINERYLPGIKLDSKIVPTANMSQALEDVKWIFEAIPVKYLRSTIELTKYHGNNKQIWVLLSKGIEQNTLMFPDQILNDVFQNKVRKAVISGPSFAMDLAQKQITAVDIASTENEILQELNKILSNEYFRPNLTNDVIGVQVCGAIKHIAALAIGISDGAGFSENTKMYFLNIALKEISILIELLNGNPSTIYGLSGIGDLVISSFGKQGRNLLVGKKIGQGQKLQDILNETGFVPEGINTLESINQLILTKNISLPFCKAIYEIIFEGKKPEILFNV